MTTRSSAKNIDQTFFIMLEDNAEMNERQYSSIYLSHHHKPPRVTFSFILLEEDKNARHENAFLCS